MDPTIQLEHDLRIILAIQSLRAFGYGFASVVLGAALADGGLSDSQVGLVFAAILAGNALVSIAIGLAGDRIGRRRAYVLLLLVMSAAGVAPEVRARVFGRYNAVAYLAGAVGALAGGGPGLVRERTPNLPTDQRWLTGSDDRGSRVRRPHPATLARDRCSSRTLDGAAASIAQGSEPTRGVVRSGRVRRWIRRLDLPGVLVRPAVRRERGAHGPGAVLFGSAPSSLVDRVGVDRYPDRPAHHDGVHTPAVERPADPDPGDAHARLGDRDAVAAIDPVADGRARATGLRHRAGRSLGTHRRGGVHQHRALRRATPRRRERRPC